MIIRITDNTGTLLETNKRNPKKHHYFPAWVMPRILNQEHRPRWHSCPGGWKGQGFKLVLSYPVHLPCTGLWDQMIIFPLFFPIHLSWQSRVTHPVSKTNQDGWEVSDQSLQAVPNQGNYVFQPLVLIFFFLHVKLCSLAVRAVKWK